MTRSVYVTGEFWEAAFERALKTFAYSLGGTIGLDQTKWLEVTWQSAFKIALVATLLSILGSIGSAQLGKHEGPSLSSESVVRAGRRAPLAGSRTRVTSATAHTHDDSDGTT